VTSVTCGATYSLAISSAGELYVWGYGDGGWLGLTTETAADADVPYVEPDPEPARRTLARTRSFERCLQVTDLQLL
jgi:alpha-tubulin suppressor-like RCC1 family protein